MLPGKSNASLDVPLLLCSRGAVTPLAGRVESASHLASECPGEDCAPRVVRVLHPRESHRLGVTADPLDNLDHGDGV